MRHETSTTSVTPAGSSQTMESAKNARKSLHVLQPAAMDKENLVGPGRAVLPPTKNNREYSDKNAVTVERLNEQNASRNTKRKKMTSKLVQTEGNKIIITAEDLTSEAGPSENYWEVLAERRRVALEEVLQENEKLHKKVEILEEEKRVCKEMLDEAKSMVEVLTELIQENDTTTNVNDSTFVDN